MQSPLCEERKGTPNGLHAIGGSVLPDMQQVCAKGILPGDDIGTIEADVKGVP